jgi:hypothetical protein
MSLPIDDDVIALDIRLKELQSKFDRAMRRDSDVTRLKEMYIEIKELECYLNVMDWQPPTYRANMFSSEPS